MNKQRHRELLAYASVCFKHMTSPFETTHLQKMNVTLDECGDLSEEIGIMLDAMVYESDIEKAEKLFQETQT